MVNHLFAAWGNHDFNTGFVRIKGSDHCHPVIGFNGNPQIIDFLSVYAILILDGLHLLIVLWIDEILIMGEISGICLGVVVICSPAPHQFCSQYFKIAVIRGF